MEIKEILERIALPARSGKKGFKNTEKLEAIEQLLKEQNSPYTLIHKSSHAWIFGQKPMDLNQSTLLVSTHSDIVDRIQNPFSEYQEEEKYFKGTYDNLGTNAACVNLMLNEPLSKDVYFSFTADEETGRCNGANYSLLYTKTTTGKEPIIFALDVTEEGYDNDRLFTIEGLHAKSEAFRQKMLHIFMKTEGEEQSFEVVPLKKNDDNSSLPKSYRSNSITMYDESVFYAKQNCNSCSLCLPGEGSMHSDSGFYVKEAVMKGFSLALAANILAFTQTDRVRIDEIKQEKDELVKMAKETAFRKKPTYNYGSDYTYYPGYSYSGYSENYISNLGNYWVNKKQKEFEKKEEDTIPGQMSLADYREMRDYNEGFYPIAKSSDNDTIQKWKEYVQEACENAAEFDEDEKDTYIKEMLQNFSKYPLDIRDFWDIEDILSEIFDEYCNKERDYPTDVDLQKMWYHRMDQMIEEAYEIACCYDKEDMDVFISDILDMYGLEYSEEYEEMLMNVFAEVHEDGLEEDEDYDM